MSENVDNQLRRRELTRWLVLASLVLWNLYGIEGIIAVAFGPKARYFRDFMGAWPAFVFYGVLCIGAILGIYLRRRWGYVLLGVYGLMLVLPSVPAMSYPGFRSAAVWGIFLGALWSAYGIVVATLKPET